MNKTTLAKDLITFRPIADEDGEFLYRLYASTRTEEMAITGWNETDVENFLRMQFRLQHVQYMENYKNGGTFEIILVDNTPAGRLYVQRKPDDIRIIDIALLPEFRGKGTGSKIMKELMNEADNENLPLSLHVEQNNPALGLYENLGFVRKDLVGIYYFMERPPASL